MTTVFVHGIPENALIWEPLRRRFSFPTVALSLPGFAAPPPDGWTGTKDELAGWLDDELSQLEPPIDVVAHDLGALLTMRLVLTGTTRLRSWVVDVPDLFAPEARFGPQMRQVQRADGLELLQKRSALPVTVDDSWAGRLRAGGVPPDLAAQVASHHTSDADEAIWSFYRSASPNVAADWWPTDATQPQGRGLLLLLPDPPEIEALSRRVATRLAAATTQLDSTHCWMTHDTNEVHDLLQDFWTTL